MGAPNLHLLGQIAVKEGYVTPDQLEECVALQALERHKALGAILVEKGYLTPARLVEITRLQSAGFDVVAADPARGGLFGQLAVRHGYIHPSQLSECLREQMTLMQSGSSLQLGQLLIRKQYLTSARFLEILRLQKKEVAKCPSCDTFFDVGTAGGAAEFSCSRCGTVIRVPGGATQSKVE
jgi:hypothetical protein